MKFVRKSLFFRGVLAVFVSTLLFCAFPLSAYAVQGMTDSTTDSDAGVVEVSRNGTEARASDIPFAIKDFFRSNKGTSKLYNGQFFGYRYPVAGAGAFVIVVTDSLIIVYLPAEHIQGLAINPADLDDQAAFKRLAKAIDAQASGGNQPLEGRETPYLFTTETRVVHNRYQYQFAVEVEPGQYYICITSDSPAMDLNNGALYVDSGLLVPAASVIIDRPPEGFDAVWEFFGGIDYRPFWVSLRTSLVAMVFVFVIGLLAARYSLRINERLRSVLDSIFTIPMVLPPTVCGFLLLIVFGNSTGFGRWLIDHGIVLVFSWPGAVIAAFVVAFPLMYRTARGALESLDPNLGDAARTLGWSDARVFFRLTLPLAWPSIAAGTVLSFARALGEFGATLFVAGNYAGITQTMPLAIYFQWMGGRTNVATFWVVVVILISFFFILFINWYASRTQRYRKAGADVDQEQDLGHLRRQERRQKRKLRQERKLKRRQEHGLGLKLDDGQRRGS